MPNKFASGKFSIAECDRCGQRYKLKQLRKLVIKQKQVSIRFPTLWANLDADLLLLNYQLSELFKLIALSTSVALSN
jgi:hypothetical protein